MKNLVVIGQGYVGLPLSRAATNVGFEVTGLEVNQNVVDNLNSGTSHVEDIPDAELQTMLDNWYRATTENAVLQDADVVVICVPTPLAMPTAGSTGRIGYCAVAEHLTKKTLVILESTTYPAHRRDPTART